MTGSAVSPSALVHAGDRAELVGHVRLVHTPQISGADDRDGTQQQLDDLDHGKPKRVLRER